MNDAFPKLVAGGSTAPRCAVAAGTHVGKVRSVNEDSCLARPEIGLFAVADGVGGAHAGEYASGLLATVLKEAGPAPTAHQFLREVRTRLEAANRTLRDETARRGEAFLSASTIVCLLLHAGLYAGVWAGDSRLYLLRNGRFRLVTRDHSQVQELVDEGFLSEAEARVDPRGNIITRAVGTNDRLELDIAEGEARPGDIFLLCSDGLNRVLEDGQIAWFLGHLAPQAAVDALIEATLDCGAPDNVTVVVVKVLDQGTAHG
jgi:serine/threonine-protein phosphatase Stp1